MRTQHNIATAICSFTRAMIDAVLPVMMNTTLAQMLHVADDVRDGVKFCNRTISARQGAFNAPKRTT